MRSWIKTTEMKLKTFWQIVQYQNARRKQNKWAKHIKNKNCLFSIKMREENKINERNLFIQNLMIHPAYNFAFQIWGKIEFSD